MGLEHCRPGLGSHRLDAQPCGAHCSILVDRYRIFLCALCVVRRASPSDQISHRDWIRLDGGGLGLRPRERRRYSGPDRARGIVGSHGREWIWTAGCTGFAICYAALIGLEYSPTRFLLYVMVISQGMLGYSLTSVMGPIVAEIFGSALRFDLRDRDDRIDRWRRRRAVGRWRHSRHDGELQACLRGSNRMLLDISHCYLACSTTQSAIGSRAPTVRSLRSGIHGQRLERWLPCS